MGQPIATDLIEIHATLAALGGGGLSGELVPGAAVNPLLLYGGCALGALGVAVAMPKRGVSLALIGGVIAAIAAGLIVLGLTVRAAVGAEPNGGPPTVFFYVFAFIGLASALRMITHPRPVYAALYFILTIVASSGMYLLLSAEFMAFALIIIYAGAILITYLFVIMLATQTPDEEDADRLSEYDAEARSPIAGTAAGFVLLAVLSAMLLDSTGTLRPKPERLGEAAVIEELPRRAERGLSAGLRELDLLEPGETIAMGEGPGAGSGLGLDVEAQAVTVVSEDGTRRVVPVPDAVWDEALTATNPELLGLNLLADHPMTIEIAGVILLMAMLGATVLARKQVDLEEEAKARQQASLVGFDDPSRGAGGAAARGGGGPA